MKAKTRLQNRESGQALVEYVLLLVILLSMGGIIIVGIQSARDNMWKRLLCEVSAACPDCKSTESAKNALPKATIKCKK